MQEIHVGLLGAGLIAREHALSLKLNPRVGKRTVFDVDPGRAESLAKDYEGHAIGSEDELVRECDVVWICTPPAFHAAAIERAWISLEK